ncbi:MAG TPA: cellulase family glycosylhydrolase, partial [Spirochaetia bacterium]|nr:cellulase family glycosylhydrolase [Spirochaetia bacterium]
VALGDSPTAFQGMLLGAGFPQEVDVRRIGLTRIRRVGTRRVNPGGARAWLSGHECIWQQNGVWDMDGWRKPVLRAPEHFTRGRDGRHVDFMNDCYRPFARRFLAAIREADPRALVFLEGEANGAPPRWSKEDGGNVVFAPHWYDGLVMARKRYSSWMAVDSASMRVVFGRRAARRSVRDQLARLSQAAAGMAGGAPVLLAEFGTPLDLDGGRAYRTGDFGAQERAMDRSFHAIEENMLSCLIWNYCPDNTNAHGDQWNGEDLSVFSVDQRTDLADINSGGRALRALVRPYPRATAGEPLSVCFHMSTRVFDFVFRSDPSVKAPTEIFVPRLQYPAGISITVSDGTFQHQPERQMLEYHGTPDRAEHRITLKPREGK